ncbi:unnamed protein product [Fructobacillus cardui]|nr:unnamed protein product [Fructobacillus cardui]
MPIDKTYLLKLNKSLSRNIHKKKLQDKKLEKHIYQDNLSKLIYVLGFENVDGITNIIKKLEEYQTNQKQFQEKEQKVNLSLIITVLIFIGNSVTSLSIPIINKDTKIGLSLYVGAIGLIIEFLILGVLVYTFTPAFNRKYELNSLITSLYELREAKYSNQYKTTSLL